MKKYIAFLLIICMLQLLLILFVSCSSDHALVVDDTHVSAALGTRSVSQSKAE
ncbi:MAG: hypothetical protein J5610_05165 [Prevotella sp.]|nr:hypothetical protein [Prevotella sp.]